ncbi:MAG TPA: zinc transporter ZupT [Candidatus Diapherotrites archaeon]|jgi:ZIP family zinc transporter|nr:zinc transporter ZupT [Candidatus Diapherotrites archaeon]
MKTILTGIFLSTLAGLSTAIGGMLIFLIKNPKKSYLAFSLAFATGVMITVSFIELLPEGIRAIGYTNALFAFFIGSAVAFLIDYFTPHTYIMENYSKDKHFDPKLLKVGLLVALGIAIHNFPEGIAIFAGNLSSFKFGLLMAIAIAIHNIPEGFAVSMPIFYATKDRKKAFLASVYSGLAEPLGAILAAIVLLPFLSEKLIGTILVFVAGVMVYICIDELLPTAYSSCDGKQDTMTFGFLLGSLVMGMTLILLS